MNKRLSNTALDQIDEIVARYQVMIADGQDPYAKTGILKDCRIQHTSMAAAGNGGPTGYGDGTTIRECYYKGFSDIFFQRICERMRWEWRD